MTDPTKPDLSREEVLQMAADLEGRFWTPIGAAEMLVALLDAKEAAETERDEAMQAESDYRRKNLAVCRELDEARASAAAAWEAGRDAAASNLQDVAESWDCGHNESRLCDCRRDAEQWSLASDEVRTLTNPDPLATEALRRVKEAVWDEGYEAGNFKDGQSTNPYTAKEAAHG